MSQIHEQILAELERLQSVRTIAEYRKCSKTAFTAPNIIRYSVAVFGIINMAVIIGVLRYFGNFFVKAPSPQKNMQQDS